MGRRAMQAEQTRLDILRSARDRFSTAGYAATSLKDIAADARVSVQTVYDSVGGKPDLVRALNDLIDQEAGIGEIVHVVMTSDDPITIARGPAQITRRLLERCGDLVRAVAAGAEVEPDLQPLATEGGRRHREGAAMVAGRLAALGALRPGVGADEAGTTIAAVCDYRTALILIDDNGMSFDEVEDWMASSVRMLVLDTRGP
jgi:AcrR family transcriptional regulator